MERWTVFSHDLGHGSCCEKDRLDPMKADPVDVLISEFVSFGVSSKATRHDILIPQILQHMWYNICDMSQGDVVVFFFFWNLQNRFYHHFPYFTHVAFFLGGDGYTAIPTLVDRKVEMLGSRQATWCVILFLFDVWTKVGYTLTLLPGILWLWDVMGTWEILSVCRSNHEILSMDRNNHEILSIYRHNHDHW